MRFNGWTVSKLCGFGFLGGFLSHLGYNFGTPEYWIIVGATLFISITSILEVKA